MARSPDHVLDRAFDEPMATLASMADFYNPSLEDMVTELSLNWDDPTIIDSRLQNLAIFRDALDGSIDLTSYGITSDVFTIMAVTLGVASDKTVPISAETAHAVSVIQIMPMTEADAAALAAAAEANRIAVLAGRGEAAPPRRKMHQPAAGQLPHRRHALPRETARRYTAIAN